MTPSVSVVVAAWPDRRGLDRALGALGAQRTPPAEVLVAGTGPDPGDLPEGVRWLAAPVEGTLVPHLWALGLDAARSDLVATTTAHFAPRPDWVEILAEVAARTGAAGVGGPVDLDPGARLADVATWSLRYSAYLSHAEERPLGDLAADNAAYERAAWIAHRDAMRGGFWEQEFHRLVQDEGRHLVFSPAMRVTMTTSFGVRRFCAQRLEHGHRFGRDRMAARSLAYRLAGIVASPLVPVILLAKVTRRMAGCGRALGPYLRALPLVTLFVVCWALGELSGYLTPGAPDG